MKKKKILENLKRILLIILCTITLFFSMPKKSEAGIITDFVDLLLKIPDGVMRLLNDFFGDSASDFKMKLNLTGVSSDTVGSIYNFEVTPYDIFTSGLEYQVPIDGDGNIGDTKYVKLPILDVNFFRDSSSIKNYSKGSAGILRPVVSNVYKSLRNIVLVMMMVVLIYIGIRIVISTAVSDQVKYKQWLVDWLVGICLLLLMQYIMSFLMNVNEIILEMLGDNKESYYYISLSSLGGGAGKSSWGEVVDEADPNNSDYDPGVRQFYLKHLDIKNGKAEGATDKFNYDENTGEITDIERKDWKEDAKDQFNNSNGNIFINARIYKKTTTKNNVIKVIATGLGTATGATVGSLLGPAVTPIGAAAGAKLGWAVGEALEDPPDEWADKTIYKCNLAEYCRTLTTFGSRCVVIYRGSGVYESFTESEEIDKENSRFMEYAILYVLLVVETCMFLYIYIKRVFKLAFYTMIAPLIAFMYPIDKLGDGKAQAFNTWFKEYLFSVLIQPLHLLLYTVFIYAASELVRTNMIYAIGAFAYMIAAEKFFKKIFGFDKAPGGGPPGLGNPAVAGEAMHGLDRLAGVGPGAKGKKDDSGKKSGVRIPLAKKPQGGGAPGGAGMGDGGSGGPVGSGETLGFGGPLGSGRSSGSRGGSGGGTGGIGGNIPGSGGNRTAGRSGITFGEAAMKRNNSNLARKLTGGKANSLKSMRARDLLASGGKAVGKFAAKNAIRGATTGLGAMAGLGAGIVASALSGEDQVMKGVYAGTKVGWNRGGQIGDWANDKVGNWYNDVRSIQADDPENYALAGKMRFDNARENFADEFGNLDSDQMSTAQEVFEYGNISSEEGVKALCKAIQDNPDASAEDIYNAVSTQESMGDLADEKNYNKAVNYEMKYGDLIDEDTQNQIDNEQNTLVEDEFNKNTQAQYEELQNKVRESENRNLSDDELSDMLSQTQQEYDNQLAGTPNPKKEAKYRELLKELHNEQNNRQALRDFNSNESVAKRQQELADRQADARKKATEKMKRELAEARVNSYKDILNKA